MTIHNKAGSNSWPGVPGDFESKPQLDTHYQRSEAGILVFSNSQVAVYAMFMDEADTELGAENALSCIGYEIVKDYSGASTGVTPAGC